jgi:hypothetical protein
MWDTPSLRSLFSYVKPLFETHAAALPSPAYADARPRADHIKLIDFLAAHADQLDCHGSGNEHFG